jgi:pimeloyl-ACP methyl ester carboxylesterase
VAVYLPPGYEISGKRYPVIYFLPNFNDPLWLYTAGGFQGFRLRESADELIGRGAMKETIVVIPNAMHFLGGSWYRNSKLTGNWEDYIVQDLVRFIDERFRTIPAAKARGLAGHGMGGTGALEIALKHPDVFGHVFAMTPAVFDSRGLQEFASASDAEWDKWAQAQLRWPAGDAADQRAFAVYMQQLLNSRQEFHGLRISYAAAAAPNIPGSFPYIGFPSPGQHAQAEREAVWAEIFGTWEDKLATYLKNKDRLESITIEYGKSDEYEWIRRGAEHISELMRSLGIDNAVHRSEGGHDSTLGLRLKTVLLPGLSRVLQEAR